MFLKLYGLSYLRFRRLKEYYEDNGLLRRNYGNCKRLLFNIFFYVLVEDVKVFLVNYVEENVILFFGRIFGYKDDDIKLFFLYETKMGVWYVFESACKAVGK